MTGRVSVHRAVAKWAIMLGPGSPLVFFVVPDEMKRFLNQIFDSSAHARTRE